MHRSAGVRPAFAITDSPEPHALRRRAILAAHPEVRELYGWDRGTIPIMLAGVAAQLALAAGVQHLDWASAPGRSALVAGILALTVGAILSHLSSMFIHEAAHNNCAPTSSENRFWAIVANLSQGVPGAMTFRKYHLRHHGHLGTLGVDADLPADWEVGRLRPSALVKALWLLSSFGFWIARGWERRTPPDRYEVLNLVVILVVDAVLVTVIGPIGLAWLLVCTLVGHSFHPVAAHFVHEHFVFEPGQETNSYYGLLNLVTYNVGYHVEHHDFPHVPGRRLPELHRRIPTYYRGLVSHRSWTWVLAWFVMDSAMGWHRRIVRPSRHGGAFLNGRGGQFEVEVQEPALLGPPGGLDIRPREPVAGAAPARSPSPSGSARR